MQSSQNISANTSTVSWSLQLLCGNGTSWNANPVGWAVYIGASSYSGTFTFDFRGTSAVNMASGSTVVTHSADGTKSVGVTGYVDALGVAAIPGPINSSGSFALTDIPRGPRYGTGGSWQQVIVYYGTGGSWQQVIVYYGTGGSWQQVIVYYETGGSWQQVGG